MTEVGLVCDSTCDLGPEWLAERNVAMVPLRVQFGDETSLDWVGLRPLDFYAKLKVSPILPKTSQPSPADFAETYARLAGEGADEIVVVTLSSRLSGTFESASLAAADAPVPIRLVDSRSASQGTGLVVKAAVEARDAGGSAEKVEAAARRAAAEVHVYFVVETLEYLVKGGRAGRAQALAASLLNIKPVLHIGSDGVIEPYKKVKGMRSAIEEIASRLAADSQSAPMRVSILSGGDRALIDDMIAALARSGARYDVESVGMVGAVIGTYTGSEVIGIAYHPAG